jgi:2-polyprenyl-3-methyl-5-hydroxy-6-metoxy-1,4-benzoquinol methylase
MEKVGVIPLSERVYSNQGNPSLITLLRKGSKRVLDVGCGSGDNAALIKTMHPECLLYGITYSAVEAEMAERHMVKCWLFDIEGDLPADIEYEKFDCIIFSHVLEHLRDPAKVLARFSHLLCNDGQVLIAVPNILSWRMRLKFIRGDFEYTSEGELDDTHLRFFTFFTADRYLLTNVPQLKVTNKFATGSFPLWWLRRYVLSDNICNFIDRIALKYWPNLFGTQTLICGTFNSNE